MSASFLSHFERHFEVGKRDLKPENEREREKKFSGQFGKRLENRFSGNNEVASLSLVVSPLILDSGIIIRNSSFRQHFRGFEIIRLSIFHSIKSIRKVENRRFSEEFKVRINIELSDDKFGPSGEFVSRCFLCD